jgi:hypothetical protein
MAIPPLPPKLLVEFCFLSVYHALKASSNCMIKIQREDAMKLLILVRPVFCVYLCDYHGYDVFLNI